MKNDFEAQRSAVAEAKVRWQAASTEVSKLASILFQPGSGYGDPDARLADEYKLQLPKMRQRDYTVNSMTLTEILLMKKLYHFNVRRNTQRGLPLL